MSVIGGAQGKLLKFGQSAILTAGSSGVIGRSMRNGIMAAFKENNFHVKGEEYELALETLDDNYDPVNTINNTNQFLADPDMFSMLGYVGTPPSDAAQSLIKGTGMAFIAPLTGSMRFRQPFEDNRHIINLRPSYDDEFVAMVRYAYALGKRKFSYFAQAGAVTYVNGVAKAVEELGLELFSEGFYPHNTLDVKDGIDKIFEKGSPDVVCILSTAGPAVAAVKEGYKRDKNVMWMVISFVGYPFAEGLNDGIDYQAYVAQMVPHPKDRSVRIVEKYHNAMNVYLGSTYQPGYASLEGYLAGRLVIQALERVPSVNITKENFLESFYESGLFVFGALQFGPYGDTCSDDSLSSICNCNQGARNVFMTKAKNGDFEDALLNGKKYRFSFTTCGYNHVPYVTNSTLWWILAIIIPGSFLIFLCISVCSLILVLFMGLIMCLRMQKQRKMIRGAGFVAEAIARMDMEDQSILKLMKKKRRKAKVLEKTLMTIIDNLKEYRPYLPDHLFAAEEDEKDDQSVRTGSIMSSKMTSGPSLFNSSAKSSHHERKSKVVDRRRALIFTYRPVAVMIVNIPQFHQMIQTTSTKDILVIHTFYIDSVTTIVKKNGGVVNFVLGDRIICSWNAVTSVIHPSRNCAETALAVSQINLCSQFPTMKPKKLSIVCGFCPNLLCGNSGSELRVFSLFSEEMNMLMQLSKWNRMYKVPILCPQSFYLQVKMYFIGHAIDKVNITYQKEREDWMQEDKQVTTLLYSIISKGSSKSDEWMYELAEVERMNERLAPLEKAWNLLLKDDRKRAAKAIESCCDMPEVDKMFDDSDLRIIRDNLDEKWWRELDLDQSPMDRKRLFPGTPKTPRFKSKMGITLPKVQEENGDYITTRITPMSLCEK